jgi:hypothetical protein
VRLARLLYSVCAKLAYEEAKGSGRMLYLYFDHHIIYQAVYVTFPITPYMPSMPSISSIPSGSSMPSISSILSGLSIPPTLSMLFFYPCHLFHMFHMCHLQRLYHPCQLYYLSSSYHQSHPATKCVPNPYHGTNGTGLGIHGPG